VVAKIASHEDSATFTNMQQQCQADLYQTNAQRLAVKAAMQGTAAPKRGVEGGANALSVSESRPTHIRLVHRLILQHSVSMLEDELGHGAD
jgi:hypothetical protein